MKAATMMGQRIDLIDGLRGKTNKRGGRLMDLDISPLKQRQLEHAMFNTLYSYADNPSRWVEAAVTERLLLEDI